MTPGRAHASPEFARAETLVSGEQGPAVASPVHLLADTTANTHPPAFAHTATDPAGAPGPVLPAIGQRLDRYVILARLGEGAMGEVYSGYDRELDRRIALKLLRPRRANDPLNQARMQREAQALAKLSHPNVVQVHDVGQLGAQLFVAMEYVAGETLELWQARHDPATPTGRRAILEMYMQAGRGLAAAHAAGIVHRDFKPSNVLVGDDGRARVLDFGLAAATRAAAEQTGQAPPLVEDPHAPGLTRTGSILGTPAYMAPEQFLCQTVDERSDVFAFSVALHEALHGASPFAGQSFAAREQSVVAGERLGPPASSTVPAWLHAVIVGGLARDPAERHASIDAMLTALADDPIARQRQRWRLAALGLAALAAAFVVLLAGLWGWQHWQRRTSEALAAERLAAVESGIDAALAAGDDADAERTFASFVDNPANRDTAALGLAWLHRAERARARADTPAAIDAFASAYVVSTGADAQAAARLGLARIFRDEMKWRGLFLALSTLTDSDATTSDPGELQALALDAKLASRDLAGAAALLRGPLTDSPRAALLPVLTALQRATETPHRHRGSAVIADLDGDDRPEVVLETDARERQLAPMLRASPGLPRIATLDLDADRFRALVPAPGAPALLVGTERVWVNGDLTYFAVVRRWRAGALEEVYRWEEDSVIAALAADVDDDGTRELLVGTGPYTRHVRELVPGADGSWSTRSPAPDIDRRGSDVVALLADDLDGDGRTEVVAGLGPWTAYELQVLRHDPASDTLRMFTRERLGNLAGVALLRRGPAGSAPEIAVLKTDEYPSESSFPPDRPLGEPAGIYLFRLVDDALVQTEFVPAPRLSVGGRVIQRGPIVGDLDGDGRDELIVLCGLDDTHRSGELDATMILVSSDGGPLQPIILGDLRPIAALDLDDDGDDDLIVSDSAAAERDRVWVLGSGDAAPPRIAAQLPEPAMAPPAADPVLAAMWRHAEELAQMGLVREAAARLAALTDQIADRDLSAYAMLRAGELYDLVADDTLAGECFARAAEAPALALAAHGAAARAFLRLGRLDEARAQLAAAPTIQEPTVAAAIEALGAEPGVDLDFAAPLAPSWRIRQPLALRRDGARKALHVDAIVAGELLSAPVRITSPSLTLAVDLDLARVEWRSGLEIGLLRDGAGLEDGGSPIGISVTTTGGGSQRTLEIACLSRGRSSIARVSHHVDERREHLGRVSIRATFLPELGEWTCRVDRGPAAPIFYARNDLAGEVGEAGETKPLRLMIATTYGPDAWLDAAIERITLTGASLAEATATSDEDPALLAARRAMVEGDPRAALDSLALAAAPGPADRLLGVVALGRLGRLAEATRALTPLLTDAATDAALKWELRALLRSDAELLRGLIRDAVGPAQMRLRVAMAYFTALDMDRDTDSLEAAWTGLAERDLATDNFGVLRLHAIVATALGHRAVAEADYRAALIARGDPSRMTSVLEANPRNTRALDLHLALAALALAAGDEAAARRELHPYASAAVQDPLFVDRLRARAELRSLWDLAQAPRRRDILRAP